MSTSTDLKNFSMVFCTLLVLAFGAQLQAAITNGDFSSGYSGWTTAGLPIFPRANMALDGAFAPLGEEIALLTTPDSFNGQAEGGASVATVEGMLSLPAGTINGLATLPSFGTVMLQSFTAAAGEKLTLQWNFVSYDETGFFFTTGGDFAFVYLTGPGIDSLVKLADVNDLTSGPNNLESIPGETGMGVFTSPALAGGSYTLGLAAFNSNDNNNATSVLLVDNVELLPVPEPNSASLAGIAAIGAALLARYRHTPRRRTVEAA